MKTELEIKKESYFKNREVDTNYYSTYRIPRYLRAVLPTDKKTRILDIGCGFGQFLNSLKKELYVDLTGIDINDESISSCSNLGINAIKIEDIRSFHPENGEKYDFITMSHVLEHIDKKDIIDVLNHIKQNLLKENGKFMLMVPNAQSYTGAYWRYEDFTHTIMFTAGSCRYVLQAAGFKNVQFVDPDGTSQMTFLKKLIIKTLIFDHRLREDFWNLILQTSFHKPSPRIYSFELKVLAE